MLARPGRLAYTQLRQISGQLSCKRTLTSTSTFWFRLHRSWERNSPHSTAFSEPGVPNCRNCHLYLRQLAGNARISSKTQIRSNSSTSVPSDTSFPDPIRPDLFYHLLAPPNPLSRTLPAYALSFLSTPPPRVDSCTIIGWLPAAKEGEDGMGLGDFRENPKFRTTMHEAILSGLREGVDEVQINGAIQIGQGWMHVHDNRNVPALGRIGDPDDIIASVLVQDSKILVDTYQPMPSYRFCTSDGLTQLTEGLARRLKVVLEERATAEAEAEGTN